MIPQGLMSYFILNESKLQKFQLYHITFVKKIEFSRYLAQNNLKSAIKSLIPNIKILKVVKTFNYHPRTSPNMDPNILINSFEPFLYRRFSKTLEKVKGFSNFRFFKPFKNLISLDTPSEGVSYFPIYPRKVQNVRIKLTSKDDAKSLRNLRKLHRLPCLNSIQIIGEFSQIWKLFSLWEGSLIQKKVPKCYLEIMINDEDSELLKEKAERLSNYHIVSVKSKNNSYNSGIPSLLSNISWLENAEELSYIDILNSNDGTMHLDLLQSLEHLNNLKHLSLIISDKLHKSTSEVLKNLKLPKNIEKFKLNLSISNFHENAIEEYSHFRDELKSLHKIREFDLIANIDKHTKDLQKISSYFWKFQINTLEYLNKNSLNVISLSQQGTVYLSKCSFDDNLDTHLGQVLSTFNSLREVRIQVVTASFTTKSSDFQYLPKLQGIQSLTLHVGDLEAKTMGILCSSLSLMQLHLDIRDDIPAGKFVGLMKDIACCTYLRNLEICLGNIEDSEDSTEETLASAIANIYSRLKFLRETFFYFSGLLLRSIYAEYIAKEFRWKNYIETAIIQTKLWILFKSSLKPGSYSVTKFQQLL